MALEKAVTTGYTPRPLQAVLHSKLKRFNVIVCHRRFGKTVFSINELVDQAFNNTRLNPQYAYIAPTYGQAERIAWDMLKQYTKNIPGVEYNESKLRCVIPRGTDKITIYLLGAENPDSIRGMYLDGAILDEFADMDPRVWGKVIRPALSDRRGWAVFIGTPKGQNHFYEIYKLGCENTDKGWFTAVYKASQTGILPEEEIDALKAEMTDDEFEQEMECSFTAAITGAYWGKAFTMIEEKGQIGKVPHDPGLLVDTFWDLGVSDTTTIWFVQQYRMEIRIIDYFEFSGEGLAFYAKVLKGNHFGGEHRKEYNYRDTNWPHDGKARDLVTGKERHVAMTELGFRPIVHPKYDVADSIDAARRLIPKLWFDKDRCTLYLKGDRGDRGISSLRTYQKKWDAKNKIYLDQPLHNWASHGADAFRLMAMALKPGQDRVDRHNLPRQCDNDYDIFTF